MPDLRWLCLRGGNCWHANMAVPRKLRSVIGKSHLLRSLHTADVAVARHRRYAALDDFRIIIEAAQRQAAGGEIMTEAVEWRERLRRLARGDRTAFSGYEHLPQKDRADFAYSHARMLAEEDAAAVARRYGESVAEGFRDVATRGATPLLQHVDAWLLEGGKKGPLALRTGSQYRADLAAFSDWAARAGIVTIEGVTAAAAGRWVTEELVSKGIHWATANRKITAVASYWRWLKKRAGVTTDPWRGQSVSKAGGRNGEKPKRPFTDAEVKLLLDGAPDTELSDAMMMAALTGARLEELFRLTVGDCKDGWLYVRQSKTTAGIRRIPIHPALVEIVKRRTVRKQGDSHLFRDAGSPGNGRERSAALSQRFGRYRQTVNVHERADGKRHSAVDFHSFRRWFITKARDAGVDVGVVAAVVGHAQTGLTDSVYRGIPADRLLQACVRAVRLP